MPYNKITENVGDRMIGFLEIIGELSGLTGKVMRDIVKGKIDVKLTLDQMVKVGFDSLPLALTTSAFVGMVFAIQIAAEFTKFGAGKFVGGLMSVAISRELGPAVTGIVVAARVAASITAEIGTMKVTEQIDAMQALGVSPVRYLIIPRFIATTVMLPLLTILTIITGFFGGYVVSIYVGKINPVEYMETAQTLSKLWDLYGGLMKTAVFGMIISIVACYRGLNTKGGAKGVGEATTSAVVITLISLFIVNYFLSMLFFK
ncbi:MAG: ABC transporter permease [Candidatus Margulisbacteria bacterium]|nr:ABC transporter permease [Candidatus Margulisiibacteriota bacterium]MBU1616830.1 ABC transporter permease [Candidatus Margulisiibacteriota bacterium]MBU1867240.1 ABC transporter permease [Candidatus Margulisiibacteriota bacterium]